MRDSFDGQLNTLRTSLVDMTQLVGFAMARATASLLEADLELAESVISHDRRVDERRDEIDNRVHQLLVREQPIVATDLRVVITTLRMSADLERMGDLAQHVAKLARRRYPAAVAPPELAPTVMEMNGVAQRIVGAVGSVIASRDVPTAIEVESIDDEMDRLNEQMFETLMSRQWAHGVQSAIDLAQLARFYERFGDHAVSVARRVIYLATGEWPPRKGEPGSFATGHESTAP